MKTETCKLYSRDFWIFPPNIIKIDPHNFEVYLFKVGPFFETQCTCLILLTMLGNVRYTSFRFWWLANLFPLFTQWCRRLFCRLEGCINLQKLGTQMSANRLSSTQTRPSLSVLQLGWCTTAPSDGVRLLDDCDFSFDNHALNLCKTGFSWLHELRRVPRSLWCWIS